MKTFEIHFSESFLRKYKKLTKKNLRLKRTIQKTFKILQKSPFYPSLKTHKVYHSVLGEMYSSRVTGDVRIIWAFSDSNKMTILAMDIGSHDDVYTNK